MTRLRFVFPGGQLELSLTDEAEKPGPVIEVHGEEVPRQQGPGVTKARPANVVLLRRVG